MLVIAFIFFNVSFRELNSYFGVPSSEVAVFHDLNPQTTVILSRPIT